MKRRWIWGLTGITGALGAFATQLFGGERHVVKSRAVCGLPVYDYRTVRDSVGEQKAGSGVGILLLNNQSDPNVKPETIKLFQMNREKLVINHCEISNVSLTIGEAGGWSFSFVAHQNKVIDGDKTVTVQKPALKMKQTSQILRNAFLVKARGIGTPPTGSTAARKLGSPVLWEIDLGKFMVENGEPGSKVFMGQSPGLGRYINQTQQVEFFFTYE